MPKKNSSWGVNTKAVEANERKAEKKRADQESKEKAKEDAKWRDDNKLDQKKKERKDKEQQKRSDALSRKEEAKRLLEQEEQTIPSAKPGKGAAASKGSNKKVNLFEIDKVKEMELKKQEQRNIARQKEKAKITDTPELEPENPNRKMAEMLAEENAVEARSVEDALTVLNVAGSSLPEDKHPEKRMKAAYNEFEQRELPLLKEENPNLRLSQLKQILHKQWQRSPDNPMNK